MPEIDLLSPWALAWVAAVLIAAGFCHGAIGLGFPLIAMPLLALALPYKAAVLFLLLPMSCVIVVNAFWGGNLRASLGRFWYMAIFPPAGAWVGTRLLIGAPPEPFLLALALMLVAFLARERLGRFEAPLVRRHEVAFGVGTGLVAGFFESVTNVSLPPMIVYLMLAGASPTAVVQVLNYSSFGTKAIQIATWSASGGVAPAFWLGSLPWCAVTVAALLAGTRIRGRAGSEGRLAWLRRFLWAMALLLVLQFFRSILA